MTLIFDIETDGLYNDVTCIHCIGIYDEDTGQTIAYNDQGSEEPITKAVQRLEDADRIIGHGIISYDLPVIKKFFPWFEPRGEVVDTLLLSRLFRTDILKVDQKRKWAQMPLQLWGRHSLEAYGYRLGEYKGCFGKTTDWKEWSQDMQDYMIQDVNVTKKLWKDFHGYLIGSN